MKKKIKIKSNLRKKYKERMDSQSVAIPLVLIFCSSEA